MSGFARGAGLVVLIFQYISSTPQRWYNDMTILWCICSLCPLNRFLFNGLCTVFISKLSLQFKPFLEESSVARLSTSFNENNGWTNLALWLVIFRVNTRSNKFLWVLFEEITWGNWKYAYRRLCMSPWPASISMYTDHRSHLLGCDSTIPSNNVFPRSGSPCLYSSWANLDIVFRSDEKV